MEILNHAGLDHLIHKISDTIGKVREQCDNKTINITYSELVALRDNSNLKPGQQYRIIDYVTTTKQENTRSVRHQFDIIVTADSTNTLNEEARACLHEGDTYFSNEGAKLEAWKIWYCLDNDADRFAWGSDKLLLRTINSVNTYSFEEPVYSVVFKSIEYHLNIGIPKSIESGPPVEVTLVDEYTIKVDSISNSADSYINNLGGIKVYSKSGKGVIYRMIDEWNNDIPYDFKNIQFKHPNDTTTYPDYYYTFSTVIDGAVTDHSMLQGYCYDNTMKEYISSKKQTLNNNVFLNNYKADYCYGNSFGINCYSNSFGTSCYGNSFGNYCYSNSFIDACRFISFGINCYSNSFANYCNNNSFGNNCNNNSFGNYCDSNSFGNSCFNNSFGKYCQLNSFGCACRYNSFGNYCYYNSFGNYCVHNSFGISANKEAILKDYVQYNHFDDSCSYNVIWNSDTTGSSNKLKNININRGVSGTSSNYNFINIDTLNADYEIQVAKNSKGENKIYCEADLIA